MRRGRKNSWGVENNGLQHKKRRESERSKNGDMKIVMVKLIIQKKKERKKTRYNNNKKFSLLGRSSGLIPLASNPGIGTSYSGLCGERCCPSCQKA
jgi:hypothetical protein